MGLARIFLQQCQQLAVVVIQHVSFPALNRPKLQRGCAAVHDNAAGGAGENAAKGLISPAQLRNAVKTANKRAYVRGQNDLGNLARAGEAVMKPLPQSGTAPRQAAMNALNVLSAIGGNAAAGPAGALAAVGAPAMLGRAVMSEPVQGYLANQLAGPIGNALAQGRLAPWQYAPQGAMYLNDPAFILSGEQDVGPDTPKRRR